MSSDLQANLLRIASGLPAGNATRRALLEAVASKDSWAGVDTRSIATRVRGWWDDLEALVKEYWNLQQITVKRTPNKLTFDTKFFGDLHVEVVGPPAAAKVHIGGASKTFDQNSTLFDILMWIDATARNRGGFV